MSLAADTMTVPIADASTASQAVTVAVQRWRKMSPGSDSREGSTPRYPLMTERAAVSAMGEESLLPLYDGQSAAVPVCAADDVEEKTVERKLKVSAKELAEIRRSGHVRVLRDRIITEFGAAAVEVRLVSLPKSRRAKAAATEGKAETRYFLVTDDGRSVGGSHPSQAEARSAAVGLMDADPCYSMVAVQARIIRDTGSSNLVEVRRAEPEVSEVTVNVTTSMPKAGAAQAGWVVGFFYHY